MPHHPRVCVEFCTKCRWNLRAAWYAQELLSTFGPTLGEVAMAPAPAGVFRVTLELSKGSSEQVLWDRKQEGRFPDSKELKQLVRDCIEPERSLGHSDRKPPHPEASSTEEPSQTSKSLSQGNTSKGTESPTKLQETIHDHQVETNAAQEEPECEDCKAD